MDRLRVRRGTSLREEMARGTMSPSRALKIAAQVAGALELAHSRGVLHRDIKPENLLVEGPDRAIKVADFGIAKSADVAARTRDGMIVGTPGYIAPEMISLSAPSPATDVYAVGALMFEMLTGQLPFGTDNPLRVMERQLREDPPLPGSIARGLPECIDRVVAQALARDPAQRIPTAALLRQRLADTLAELGTAEDAPSGLGTAAGPAPDRARDPQRRSRPRLRAHAGAAAARVGRHPAHRTAGVAPGSLVRAGGRRGALRRPHAGERGDPECERASPAVGVGAAWDSREVSTLEAAITRAGAGRRLQYELWLIIPRLSSVANPDVQGALLATVKFAEECERQMAHARDLAAAVEALDSRGGSTPQARYLRTRVDAIAFIAECTRERSELYRRRLSAPGLDLTVDFIPILQAIENTPLSDAVARPAARVRRVAPGRDLRPGRPARALRRPPRRAGGRPPLVRLLVLQHRPHHPVGSRGPRRARPAQCGGGRRLSGEGHRLSPGDGRAWPLWQTLPGVRHRGTANPVRRERNQLLPTLPDRGQAAGRPLAVAAVEGGLAQDDRRVGRAVAAARPRRIADSRRFSGGST